MKILHFSHPGRLPLVLALGASCLASTIAPQSTLAKPQDKEVPRGATPREIELGKKAAAELEKNPKIKLLDGSKDPKAKALLDRLNNMARELGKASARPDIEYKVKVIEDDDLNAFTLPDGHIYLFRGLIDFAGSDDEIAGVLAHEIGHNARLHALRGQAQAKKLNWVGLAAMAAMLAGGRSGADIGQFSQYLLLGIMNGYSEEYEKEADVAAVEQMQKTKWNPSSVVTFMQRLAQEEKRRPEWEPGIFRTHPPTEGRASAALDELKKRSIAYTPRDVMGATQAVVEDGKDRITVKSGKQVLLELAAPEDKDARAPIKKRAETTATQINDLLRANLKMHELTAEGNEQGARLLARGNEVARISPADAKLQNLTPLAAAEKWRDAFRRLFWRETINGKL